MNQKEVTVNLSLIVLLFSIVTSCGTRPATPMRIVEVTVAREPATVIPGPADVRHTEEAYLTSHPVAIEKPTGIPSVPPSPLPLPTHTINLGHWKGGLGTQGVRIDENHPASFEVTEDGITNLQIDLSWGGAGSNYCPLDFKQDIFPVRNESFRIFLDEYGIKLNLTGTFTSSNTLQGEFFISRCSGIDILGGFGGAWGAELED